MSEQTRHLCRVFTGVSGAAAGLLALLLALQLAGCAAATPDPDPDPSPSPKSLTITAAGGRYLDAVCEVNTAWDVADTEIDLVRIAAARGDAPDTKRFAAAMQAVAQASAAAADMLGDDSVRWPREVADSMKRVRATLVADAEQAEKIIGVSPGELVSYSWEGSDEAAAAAAAARTALGLPEDARAVCAERAKEAANPPQDAPAPRSE